MEEVFKPYKMLIEKKKSFEKYISNIQKELDALNRHISDIKWLFSPHVSISKISSNTQKDRYIGKFMVYQDNGKSKQVSISLGSVDKYKGVDDPDLLKHSVEKATKYLRNKYPEKYM
jgi:hypothetical protein